MSDGEIMNQIRDAREHFKAIQGSKEKLNEHDRETLFWLGSWRGGVLRYEATCEGNILTLLRAAANFQEIGDEGIAYKLIMFAGSQYGFYLPEAVTTENQRKAIASKYSRRADLLPDRFLCEGDVFTSTMKTEPEPSQMEFDEVF